MLYHSLSPLLQEYIKNNKLQTRLLTFELNFQEQKTLKNSTQKLSDTLIHVDMLCYRKITLQTLKNSYLLCTLPQLSEFRQVTDHTLYD